MKKVPNAKTGASMICRIKKKCQHETKKIHDLKSVQNCIVQYYTRAERHDIL
jgi:hypothetical protein